MIIVEPKVYVQKYDGVQIMKNIEKACRTCYRSEGSITDTSYKTLLTNCINRGHESVLEHEKITVRLICDLGVYKDLTRHRIASFSIESTRYCNYSKDKFNNQIKFIKPCNIEENTERYDIWQECMQSIEDNYNKMASIEGTAPDQLRMMLPHSVAAEVCMTANIREWKHILSLRSTKFVHPAVRQVMIPLLLEFKNTMPEIFNTVEYDETFCLADYAKLEYMED